jgi:hypothetical protein
LFTYFLFRDSQDTKSTRRKDSFFTISAGSSKVRDRTVLFFSSFGLQLQCFPTLFSDCIGKKPHLWSLRMCKSPCVVGRSQPSTGEEQAPQKIDEGVRDRYPRSLRSQDVATRRPDLPTFERASSLPLDASTKRSAAVCARQKLVALTNGANANSCTFGARSPTLKTSPPPSSSSSGSQDFFAKYDEDFAAACLGLQRGERKVGPNPWAAPKPWPACVRGTRHFWGDAGPPAFCGPDFEQTSTPTPCETPTSMHMRKAINRRMCKIMAECNDIVTDKDKIRHMMQASPPIHESATTGTSEYQPALDSSRAPPARQSPKPHIRPARHVASIMRDASLHSCALTMGESASASLRGLFHEGPACCA